MNITSVIFNKELKIVISGDFVGAYAGKVDAALALLECNKVRKIKIVARELKTWDSSLLVFVAAIGRRARNCGVADISFVGFDATVATMMRTVLVSADVVEIKNTRPTDFLERLGCRGIMIYTALGRGLRFVGRVGASVARLMRGCARTRKIDWLFAFEDVGPRAILIVSLISFLIGLILAFVGAAQLKLFGAQVYVASLVAIASIRIMGAMMTGIIMAGRTGASYAATIGTMQTNEELDALDTMGIDKIDFLVLPRVFAMTISMPILTLLADVMAIFGGAFIGVVMLGVPWSEYVAYTNMALDMQNFAVGIFHGAVYGIIIALCGCYYGINCGRNASAVGHATTRAVVASIVWMVVATGFITFLFEVLGI